MRTPTLRLAAASAILVSTLVGGLALAQTPPALTNTVTATVTPLAWADDGSRLVALEQLDTGVAITETALIIGAGGIEERLPISERLRGGGGVGAHRDRVAHDACRKTADTLQAVARDYRGLSVRGGLCSHPERRILGTTQQRPRPNVPSKAVGEVHLAVGFAGPTFVSPRETFAVVLGTDFNGLTRVGTAPWPLAPLRP